MIKVYLLSFILIISFLHGRENPFKETLAYLEELNNSKVLMYNLNNSNHIENKNHITSNNRTISILSNKNITLELVDFIDISYLDTSFKSKSIYNILKLFYINEERKVVIDFISNKSFLTKKIDLDSHYFKKLIIGSHFKKNYFRFVIVLKYPISKYNISYKDDSFIIKFNKNSMN